jgi:hypothetical protein
LYQFIIAVDYPLLQLAEKSAVFQAATQRTIDKTLPTYIALRDSLVKMNNPGAADIEVNITLHNPAVKFKELVDKFIADFRLWCENKLSPDEDTFTSLIKELTVVSGNHRICILRELKKKNLKRMNFKCRKVQFYIGLTKSEFENFSMKANLVSQTIINITASEVVKYF